MLRKDYDRLMRMLRRRKILGFQEAPEGLIIMAPPGFRVEELKDLNISRVITVSSTIEVM